MKYLMSHVQFAHIIQFISHIHINYTHAALHIHIHKNTNDTKAKLQEMTQLQHLRDHLIERNQFIKSVTLPCADLCMKQILTRHCS